MACVVDDSESYGTGDLAAPPPPPAMSPDEKKPIPRRNLSEAFEALCVDTHSESGTTDDTTTGDDMSGTSGSVAGVVVGQNSNHSSSKSSSDLKKGAQPFFSPTSVTQPLDNQPQQSQQTATKSALETNPSSNHGQKSMISPKATEAAASGPYEFVLHGELQRDLPQALISRVSLYAIIHDINKEAAAMAANDPQNKEELNKEDLSPLVQAVNGSLSTESGPEVKNAMIDEETWLLDAIQNRAREEGNSGLQPHQPIPKSKACPATFLQAMGEKEYENPVHALSGGSRTQLWKPSRSWWEAKSGKNPWIEPNSHNKRWRYLWPFIHYHKFLAKCIKKLKRNGADVKHSVSPVAVFLREEVCAVSDHLASVSLFGSEEWMACLQHFTGWTDDAAEDILLAHVRQLKLRPLNEPGDVDSPLLRSQIDEHFLKAIALQREQLREIPTTIEAPKKAKGPPPMYPRNSSASAAAVAAAAAAASTPPSQLSSSGVRRPRYPAAQHGHPHNAHYWNGVPPPTYGDGHMVYGDNSSVQSGISTESGFAQQQQQHPPYSEYHPNGPPHHNMPPHSAQYSPYYSAPPPMYGGSHHQYPMDPHPHEMYHAPPMGSPHHHPHEGHGWLDPALAPYGVQPYFGEMGAPTPESPQVEQFTVTEKEEKVEHTSDATPHHLKASPQNSPQQGQQGYSPFWSHLVDGATQSLATPAKAPSTPNRPSPPFSGQSSLNISDQTLTEDPEGRASMAAQPLLLRGYNPYGYGHYGARDGYAPPSPATQFMMPPTSQNNNFYYGNYAASSSTHSPGRRGSSNNNSHGLPLVRRSPHKETITTPNHSVVVAADNASDEHSHDHDEPPTPVRKMVELVNESTAATAPSSVGTTAPSPSTVETSCHDSDSLHADTTTTTAATTSTTN